MRSRLFIVAAAVAVGLSCFQPLAARADAWGAISIDLGQTDTDPYYGVGGGDTEQEASDSSMKFCAEAGGKSCKAVVTYQQCGAYAASPAGGGWGKDTTKQTAEAKAVSGCDHDGCKVVVSDCN